MAVSDDGWQVAFRRVGDQETDSQIDQVFAPGYAEMPTETHIDIDSALTRVERERTHVEEERQAYERFRSGVESLSLQPVTAATTSPSAGGGSLSVSGRSQHDATANDVDRVRTSFIETVRPYGVADLDAEESLFETIREELDDSIAFALEPETDADMNPTGSARDLFDDPTATAGTRRDG